MSWIKDLAGKAEDLLNQIDQNAAAALQREKKVSQNLIEATWHDSTHSKSTISPQNTSSPKKSGSSFHSVQSLPNISVLNSVKSSIVHSDDELMSYLNSTEPASPPTELTHTVALSDETKYPLFNSDEKLDHVTSTASNLVTHTNLSTDQSNSSSIRGESPTDTEQTRKENITINDLLSENGFLRNELRSVNTEMFTLSQRTKVAERDCINLQEELSKMKANNSKLKMQLKEKELSLSDVETKYLLCTQKIEKLESLSAQNRVSQASSDSNLNEVIQSLEVQITDKQKEMELLKGSYLKELTTFKERLSVLENENISLNDNLHLIQHQFSQSEERNTVLHQQCDKLKHETEEARIELEQYRIRAQRILQDKEKLITELRGDAVSDRTSSVDDTLLFELEHLKQERELLREEVIQLSNKLKTARDDLQEAEKRLEIHREQVVTMQHTLQQTLQEECRKRQAAEDDCRLRTEELREVQENSTRQQNSLSVKLQECEIELSKLRKQLVQRPSSSLGDELESRLHTLTQTLVQKQCALESVTTEKNALRLQLEKLENKHRETLLLLQQTQGSVINVNDTDDAKCSRVPSFLEESPFDTGMTRRVKRAYSSLDAVSIRTGVFLRRYPLARILMLCYMVLLHLWVMLVLFTYTPQAH